MNSPRGRFLLLGAGSGSLEVSRFLAVETLTTERYARLPPFTCFVGAGCTMLMSFFLLSFLGWWLSSFVLLVFA